MIFTKSNASLSCRSCASQTLGIRDQISNYYYYLSKVIRDQILNNIVSPQRVEVSFGRKVIQSSGAKKFFPREYK